MRSAGRSLGISKTPLLAAIAVLGALGAQCAWADDASSDNATTTTSASQSQQQPAACTSPHDFVRTDCPLAWHGIRLYATIDVGAGWQSHGAPLDPRVPPGGSYLIQRFSRSPIWDFAPNALNQSNIGIRGIEPLDGGWSFVFDVEAAFNPTSFRLASGPASQTRNIGTPLNRQTSSGDSSRKGQWYNDDGYLGFSSGSYGAVTVFWQDSLMLDAVVAYDPMGGSYAFSPIGYRGDACGPGDTETCRSTSLKYRLTVGRIRFAALWPFGGYRFGNGARGGFEGQLGVDILDLGGGTLSLDGIGSYERNAVGTAIVSGAGTLNAAGAPIPPYLPQTLVATLSDVTGVMFVGSYTKGPAKLNAGYTWIQFAPPSDPARALVDIGDIPIGAGYGNGTVVSDTAYSASAGFKDRVEQIFWVGGSYSLSERVAFKASYYVISQNNYFLDGPNRDCTGAAHAQCSGSLQAVSGVVDWQFAPKWDTYFGCMFSEVRGGLANGFLEHSNIDPTVGLRLRF